MAELVVFLSLVGCQCRRFGRWVRARLPKWVQLYQVGVHEQCLHRRGGRICPMFWFRGSLVDRMRVFFLVSGTPSCWKGSSGVIIDVQRAGRSTKCGLRFLDFGASFEARCHNPPEGFYLTFVTWV